MNMNDLTEKDIANIVISMVKEGKDKEAMDLVDSLTASNNITLTKEELYNACINGNSIVLRDTLFSAEYTEDMIPFCCIYAQNVDSIQKTFVDDDTLYTKVDTKGNNLFHYFCMNKKIINDTASIKKMLKDGYLFNTNFKNNDGKVPIFTLLDNVDNIESLNLIVNSNNDLSQYTDNTGLSVASYIANNIEATYSKTIELFTKKSYINNNTKSPKNNPASILLKRNIGIDYLVENVDLKTTNVLQDNGDNINALLYLADLGVSSILKEYNSNVVKNIKDSNGNTIYHKLALKGIDVLSYEGAKFKNNNNSTSYHFYAMNGDAISIIRVFSNTLFKYIDNNGNTPYHILSANINKTTNPLEQADELINLNGVEKYKNKDGDTVLHILAKLGIRQVAQNSNSKIVMNNENKTPVDIIIEGKEYDIKVDVFDKDIMVDQPIFTPQVQTPQVDTQITVKEKKEENKEDKKEDKKSTKK